MLFLPRKMTEGKSVWVGATPLAIASSFCRPDLDIRWQPGECRGGTFPEAQGVVIMFFRQMVLRPLLFGATPRAPFHRQARRFELFVQPPSGGIHHGGILQGLLGLRLDVRIAKICRRLMVLLEVAGFAGQDEIADPVASPSALGHNVFNLQGDSRLAAVRTRSPELQQPSGPLFRARHQRVLVLVENKNHAVLLSPPYGAGDVLSFLAMVQSACRVRHTARATPSWLLMTGDRAKADPLRSFHTLRPSGRGS